MCSSMMRMVAFALASGCLLHTHTPLYSLAGHGSAASYAIAVVWINGNKEQTKTGIYSDAEDLKFHKFCVPCGGTRDIFNVKLTNEREGLPNIGINIILVKCGSSTENAKKRHIVQADDIKPLRIKVIEFLE
uniref:Uncharacterized protein n=1 Tax=Glossina pallidipes TaxID=7398 RepID=A0A1A9ZA51_GLOPL